MSTLKDILFITLVILGGMAMGLPFAIWIVS